MKIFTIGIVGGWLLAAGAAQAAAIQSSDAYLRAQKFGNIPYLSGGVGIEERDRLKSMAADDNLQLSFALTNGHYLGAAEVAITDSQGKEVFDAVTDGPLLFAKLPAGHYLVEATALGKTIKRTVNIPANGRAQMVFAWAGSDHDQSKG